MIDRGGAGAIDGRWRGYLSRAAVELDQRMRIYIRRIAWLGDAVVEITAFHDVEPCPVDDAASRPGQSAISIDHDKPSDSSVQVIIPRIERHQTLIGRTAKLVFARISLQSWHIAVYLGAVQTVIDMRQTGAI